MTHCTTVPYKSYSKLLPTKQDAWLYYGHKILHIGRQRLADQLGCNATNIDYHAAEFERLINNVLNSDQPQNFAKGMLIFMIPYALMGTERILRGHKSAKRYNGDFIMKYWETIGVKRSGPTLELNSITTNVNVDAKFQDVLIEAQQALARMQEQHKQRDKATNQLEARSETISEEVIQDAVVVESVEPETQGNEPAANPDIDHEAGE